MRRGFNNIVHSDKFHKMELFDMAILLANVWKGSGEESVGFEDSEQTLEDLTKSLNSRAWVKLRDLESSLWSCNLLNENNKFWHPKGLSFDDFVKRILQGKTFDKVFNTVEKPIENR